MATLLVVDDERGIRDFLAEALVDDGHGVAQAATAREALDQLAARPFDLMITDLAMPGDLDGVDLLRLAKERQPELEVVVLTAHGTIQTAVTAMKLGAFDYLEKPLGNPAQLRTLVRRGLARQQQTKAPATGSRSAEQFVDPIDRLRADLGAALGRDFQVGDVIGKGAFAVVFQVRDRGLDRLLAAKVLYSE